MVAAERLNERRCGAGNGFGVIWSAPVTGIFLFGFLFHPEQKGQLFFCAKKTKKGLMNKLILINRGVTTNGSKQIGMASCLKKGLVTVEKF